jgi:quinol monooxygenase YgiN
MSQVVVIAELHVAEGKLDAALDAVREVVESTHAEAGCLSYALHQDPSSPNTLWMIEKWTSQVALDAHMQSAHFKALGARAAAEGLFGAAPAIHILNAVPFGDPMKGSI